jgi:hypothetical protein
VHGDYYTTMAQVLPVLLLALIWDSAYLERLRTQSRRTRSEDPAGVRFWTKPRVRVYMLFVAAVVVSATAVTLLVLGDMIPDSLGLRIALACALLIVLGTLMTRIYYHVVAVTAPEPAGDAADGVADE